MSVSEILEIGEIGEEKNFIAQSPLDLYTQKATYVQYEPFQFNGFNREFFPEIVNTGTTVRLTARDDSRPRVTGGGLKYPEYMLHNVHFHWDSEHSINGVRFALECHIQMMASHFKTMRLAANSRGLATLVTLWKYTDQENAAINTILQTYKSIVDRPKLPCLAEHSIFISQLMPENTQNYFRYEGTDGGGPYLPNTVTVFTDCAYLTRHQLSMLADIQNEVGDQVVYNNKRTIKSKFAPPVFFSGKKNSCRCLQFP